MLQPRLWLAILGGCALLFLLTTLPFAARLLRRDPLLALLSPLLLLLRALSLLAGMACGFVRFRPFLGLDGATPDRVVRSGEGLGGSQGKDRSDE
jgi:hypothetical protein